MNNNNRLFVGNLSLNVTDDRLQEVFATHGSVLEAKVITDYVSGHSRGFAFITMSTPEEAQGAITAMNGASLDGRPLNVKIAQEREERSADVQGFRSKRRGYGKRC